MKIIKPTLGGHDGSSFRELLDMWEERGYCEVISGPSSRSSDYNSDPDSPEAKCWIGEIGDILLYDFPLLDRLKHDYNLGLFANSCPPSPKAKNWIFWPKHSKLYDDLKQSYRRKYSDRNFTIGFLGAPTTKYRNRGIHIWGPYCDLLRYQSHKIDHLNYLHNLSYMKYGLCLPGVGPKCLRDIELMGMGTVPLFTWGIPVKHFDSYFNPLIENVHYIFGSDPEDTLNKINNIDENKWKEMSNNCIEWFEKNCSIEGSFNITMEIINGKNI